ncbi:hypothetical protein [Bradyrhizobium guangzhouense]|uniref:hypothetical protein n=1 Tax=Bradyrhizobium guangzhouense TaxID=1325095 RepID=UPI001FE1DED9|nr:hypothetical protein [Bradyrhizobium guangzhouense]
MARRPTEPEVHAGIHRGIHYVLKPNAAPGFWRYGYTIADKVRSGRVQGRLPLLAIRRVRMRIDRDMRPEPAEAPRTEKMQQDPPMPADLPNGD